MLKPPTRQLPEVFCTPRTWAQFLLRYPQPWLNFRWILTYLRYPKKCHIYIYMLISPWIFSFSLLAINYVGLINNNND